MIQPQESSRRRASAHSAWRRLSLHLISSAALAAAGVAVLRAQTPGQNVNMVSGATLPAGDPFLQRQNEPSAAVSTRNPLHLLAGANDYRTVDFPGLPAGATGDAWLGVYKSFDGGQTWRSTLMPGYPQDTSALGMASPLKGYEAGADPTVRAGTNGLFYYSGIVFNRGENAPSALFISRWIDNNNVPGGDSIVYLDAQVVETGTKKKFIDKPYMVVDVPRAGHYKTCNITAPGTTKVQKVPAATVYLAYMLFDDKTSTSKLLVTRSRDCGVTWSKPSKASEQKGTYQGVSMAVDPGTGALYLAWRRFKDNKGGDAIQVTKSIDLGRDLEDKRPWKDKDPEPVKFGSVTTIAQIAPFDQGDSLTTFRTNSYPTVAVDASGRFFVAWTERGWGPISSTAPPPGPGDPVPGDARVVMTVGTLTDKNTHKQKDCDDNRKVFKWSIRRTVDNAPAPGHQIMPVLSIVANRLSLLYLDLREDVARVFETYVDDSNIFRVTPAKRHTIDVRVIQGTPGDPPIWVPSVPVSQYPMGSRPGSTVIEQLQFNVPNLPLFASGTTPFIGDYIELAGQTFLQDATGKWTFNTSATGPAVMHAFWTDNRDVRPPPDGDWTTYTPPTTTLATPTAPPCTPGSGRTGMRNSNIYSSRISPGLLVGSPINTKRLSEVAKTFVVFAQNNTDVKRRYRFTIANQPPGGRASFLQSFPGSPTPPLTTLDATLAERSTASRTVYVTSSDPTARVDVTVVEVEIPTSPALPPVKVGGLQGTIVLNPDVTNPDVTNPDVTNAEVFNPDVTNPDVTNPDVTNPDVTNPDVTNRSVGNVRVANPDVTNPDVTNPDVTNPNVRNPDVTNPDVTNPDVTNGALVDVTWTVTNNGNTAGSFAVKPFLSRNAPAGFKKQLILHKRYATPITVVSDCSLKTQTQTVLVANIANPDVTNPDVTNPDVTNPDVTNPDVTNPDVTNSTIALGPGESAQITLRVLAPNRALLVLKNVVQANGDTETVLVDPRFDPREVATPVVQSIAVGTADAAAGITTPPVFVALLVTTNALPPGVATVPYDRTLHSFGGSPGPKVWNIVAGSGTLPPGLTLHPLTGQIDGIPTTAGSYPFTARVTDSQLHTATKDFVIHIAPFAHSQSVETLEDQDLPITLTAVGPVTDFVITQPPAHGSLSGSPETGSGTYEPAEDYFGADEFKFKARLVTPFGVLLSPEATVTINVLPVNNAPSFIPGADQTVNEDSGAQIVPGWATSLSVGPPNESGQTITSFEVTNNTNAALFAVLPAINPLTGELTYTPADDAYGSAVISVRVLDNGGNANGGSNSSTTHDFTIEVRAVNDVPSFTKGADQVVLADAGAQTVNGWATSLSKGPANESAQTLNFVVSANLPSLFAVQPAVAANGTLTYTPSFEANGTALVSVQIHDSGGVDYGGVDTSATQTFTITVVAHAGRSLLVPLVSDSSGLALSNNFGPPATAFVNDAGDYAFFGIGGSAVFYRAASAPAAVRVFQAGDPVPGFPGSRAHLVQGLRLNNAGVIAFVVDWATATGQLQSILMTFNGAALQTVLTGFDTAPDSGGKRYERGIILAGLSDAGDIVFGASLSPNTSTTPAEPTLFRVPMGGAAARIAWHNQPAPGTAGNFSPIAFGSVRLSNAGEVLFASAISGAGGSGLFVWNSTSGIRKIAAIGDTTPAGTPFVTFPTLTGGLLNNTGQVAFTANGSIFLNTSPVGNAVVVRPGDPVPAAPGGTFSAVGFPNLFALDDAGDIGFQQNVAAPTTPGGTVGLFRYRASGVEVAAYRTQAAPGLIGQTFTAFSSASMNNAGAISFRGDGAASAITNVPTNLGVFQQSIGNPLAAVLLSGAASPLGGTYYVSTVRTQTLANGSVYLQADLPDATTDFGEFLVTPTGTTTLMSTADLLPAGSNTLLAERGFGLSVAGDYVGFSGQRAGGRWSFLLHRISTHATTVIATGGTAAVGGGRLQIANVNSLFVNVAGQIAFSGQVVGGGAPTRQAVFIGSAGSVSRIVVDGDLDTGGRTIFSAGLAGLTGMRMNSAGQVVFSASGKVPVTGLIRSGIWIGSTSSAPAKVAFGDDPVDSPAGPKIVTFNVAGPAMINDSGQVMFSATTSPAPATTPVAGLFVGTAGGTAATIASVGGAAPGGGTYTAFAPPWLNGSGEVAFMATVTGGAGGGIFVGSPSVPVVALALNGAAAPGGGTYSIAVLHPDVVMNDQHDVSFRADLTGGPGNSAYFLRRGAEGAILPILYAGQAAPGTPGVFDTLPPSLNNLPGEFNQLGPDGDVSIFAGYVDGPLLIRGYWHVKLSGAIELMITRGGPAPGTGGGHVATFSQVSEWTSGGRFPLWVSIVDGEVANGIFVYEPSIETATPTGLNVAVTPTDSTTHTTPVTLTFDNVLAAGTTTLAVSASGPPLPPLYVAGAPSLFYALTTSAVFAGEVTACVDFTGTTFPLGSSIVLLNRQAGGWQQVSTGPPVGNVICGRVSVISSLAVVALPGGEAAITPGVAAVATVMLAWLGHRRVRRRIRP